MLWLARLEELKDRPTSQIPGSQQQHVALAQGFAASRKRRDLILH